MAKEIEEEKGLVVSGKNDPAVPNDPEAYESQDERYVAFQRSMVERAMKGMIKIIESDNAHTKDEDKVLAAKMIGSFNEDFLKFELLSGVTEEIKLNSRDSRLHKAKEMRDRYRNDGWRGEED